MALGNPEHPGRTRGMPGSLSWKAGFHDAGGYKCRDRKKKVDQTTLQALHARVKALEDKREVSRSKQHVKATLEATPPSQRKSSMASTELPEEPVFTAPASYPVDAIMESQHCHLMTQWMQFKVKAVVGSVF